MVGAGGLAKSRSVRAALGGKAYWNEGNATAFDVYVKLYQRCDEFVVIDDVDALYANRSGVRLLKCLCQTEDENRRAHLAAELLASDAYDSTAERVKAFVRQGGGCRATFFNYRRKLGNGNRAG